MDPFRTPLSRVKGELGGLFVEDLDCQVDDARQPGVLAGPGIFDLPRIDTEQPLRQQSERLARPLLLRDDFMNLPIRQHVGFNQ